MGRYVALQMALAWAAGVIIAPLIFYSGLAAAFMGGPLLGLAVAGLTVLGSVALLYAIAAVSKQASGLTSTAKGRLAWAWLVLAGGLATSVYGVVMNGRLGLGLNFDQWPALAAGGAGYALCAAILAGRWFTLSGLAIAASLVAGGSYLSDVRADKLREQAHEQALHEKTSLWLGLAFSTSMPGYRLEHDGRTAWFTPEDRRPGEAQWARTITLSAEHGEFSTKYCSELMLVVNFRGADNLECTVERPGLWYRSGRRPKAEEGCPCGLQEYVMQRGTLYLRIGATDAVPRKTLREAIQRARPLTEADLRRLLFPSPAPRD
ncbi:hypothetical protein AB0K16_56100 [Nonomuraea jabiensis]|uniref:hypothetical protein n=1 Tax=Nonomuraea jabiensis TaxID=882448 RepID=UPI0034155D11